MMWPVILTLFLCILYGWGVVRWNSRQQHSLPARWLIAALLLRCIFSMAYGYIFIQYYNGDDTWMLHQGIEEEYQQLITDPSGFFLEPLYAGELFRHPSITTGIYYYLMDLENWMICKPLALLQPFTGGNYYCQAVLFNFLPFLGNLLLYRFFIATYPRQRTILYFWLFLFPPLLFWWSGLRADGLILFFTALSLTGMQSLATTGKKSGWWLLLTGTAGWAILRIQLLFLWVPAIAAYALHVRLGWSHWRSIGVVYGLSALLFFGSGLLSPKADLTRWVAERQEQFKALPGKTRFELNDLEPGLASFIKTLPQAFTNIFLRPYPWEARGALQWLAAGDVAVLLFVIAVFLFTRAYTNEHVKWESGIIYPFVFALSLYIFIGLTIPFPGAIVRYKVQAEYLILLFFAIRIPLKRIY